MTNRSVTTLVEWFVSGAWAAVPGVLDVAWDEQGDDGGGNPLQFGAAVLPGASVVTTLASYSAGTGYALRPIRVTVTVTGFAARRAFTGVVARRGVADGRVTYTCAGFDLIIEKASPRSPLFYRRPVFTETTAISDEDPASPACVTGIGNRILWLSGGRPAAQAGSYPGAAYYYHCDPTAFAPEWSWLDGAPGWSRLLDVARDAGGVIYQDADGVVRFADALRLGETAGAISLGPSQYQAVSVEEEPSAFANVAICNFTRRALQGEQVVYETRDAIPLAAGATYDLEIVTDLPCWRFGATEVTAVNLANIPVTIGTSLLSSAAMQRTVRLTNATGAEATVTRVAQRGEPIAAVHQGTATATTTAATAYAQEVRLADSDLIQSLGAARRRAQQHITYAGTPRPRYRLSRIPYTPTLSVGGAVLLTDPDLGLVDEPCRVTRLSTDDAGGTQDVTLTPVGDLLTRDDFFVVGRTYSAADVRRVGI